MKGFNRFISESNDDLEFLKLLGLDEVDKDSVEQRARSIISAYNQASSEILIVYDPSRRIFKQKLLDRGLLAYTVSEIRELGNFIPDSFVLSNTWNPEYELHYFDPFERLHTIQRGKLLDTQVKTEYSSRQHFRSGDGDPSETGITNIKEV